MIYNLSKEMVDLALKILDKHDGYYIKEIDDVLQSCKQALSHDITDELLEKIEAIDPEIDTDDGSIDKTTDMILNEVEVIIKSYGEEK